MTKNSIALRSVSAAAIVGLTLGMSPMALAQDVTPSNPAPLPTAAPIPAQVIQEQESTITIHKVLNPTATQDPTGNAPTIATGGKSVQGITFNMSLVTLEGADITTNDGFKKLSDAIASARDGQGNINLEKLKAISGISIGAPTPLTTGADGTIKTGDLPLGVYLFEEQLPGSIEGTNLTQEELDGLIPAKPFVVFLPMTNPADTTQWNYNPIVTPKNSSASVKKEVKDAEDLRVGDVIDYKITSTIPAAGTPVTTPEGLKIDWISKYIVTDSIDSKLTYTEGTAVLNIVAADGTETKLEAGTDYVESIDLPDIKWTFSEEGLKKLTAAGPTAVVETDLQAKINQVAGSNGDYENGSSITFDNTPGNTSDTDDKTIPSEKVITKMAKLEVLKKDEAGTMLGGATFQVYQCSLDDAPKLLGAPLEIGGVKEWTTSSEDATKGQLMIDGLKVTDWANGIEVTPTFQYCLVETKAPEGYELLAKPIPVPFTEKTTGDNVAVALVSQEVVNVPKTTPNLPLTGGAGIGVLAAIGAALVGAGAWFARRNSKKA